MWNLQGNESEKVAVSMDALTDKPKVVEIHDGHWCQLNAKPLVRRELKFPYNSESHLKITKYRQKSPVYFNRLKLKAKEIYF
ncbi:hypothetical protein [Nostoc sp.]|uniref:hypothetical protein n=1 Tax=Nostoc sp. TaxID=1180 RepID=UPI002FF661B0